MHMWVVYAGRHLSRTLKNFHVPAEDRTGDLSILRRTLYLVAIKAGLYRMLPSGSGEPGLVDRVLALHAGSRGFDSHRGHMSERFFRSNRPGYPHPVSSELEISGIRVAVGDCSVTERRRWRPPYQTGKTVHVHANTTNTTRTGARRRVCAAMVPYR